VVLTCFFAASYRNADIGRYYLGPVLMAWTWLAILGAAIAETAARAVDALARWAGLRPVRPWFRVLSGDPAAATSVTAAIAAALLVTLAAPTLLAIGDRFALIDESHDRSVPAWVDHALGVMEADAVVVSWWSYSTPLWYAQRVEGRRPDLVIIDDRTRLDEGLGDITDVIDAHLGHEPVYVIRDDPAEIAMLAERYVLELIDGPDARTLTRVVARRGSGS
jgi:hypothetical protein